VGDNPEEQTTQMINLSQEFKPIEAIQKAKEIARERKFKESVDVVFRLNVDPKQGDQNIRGTCVLPSGLGKEVKVAVFVDKDREAEVKEIGADFAGTEDIIKQITDGNILFDKLITTPDMMQALKPLARVLMNMLTSWLRLDSRTSMMMLFTLTLML
jgi:large subunit ribosomal protein L1